MRSAWVAAAVAVIGLSAIAYGIWLRPSIGGDDVVRIAYSFKNGGGYNAKQSGAPEDVNFSGSRILRASAATNCSGFTFCVAMRAAQERSLLKNAKAFEIKRFQKQWYGVIRGSEVKTLVTAMETLGVGREIYPLDARPGDFVQFWAQKVGHSVVFIEWIKREGKIVGFRYRSSQPATNGVGDHSGYFTTSGYATGIIEPEKFFVGRLNG